MPRIGLVCVEPLRVLGMQALLGDGIEFHISLLEGTRTADLDGLELVVIDGGATTHLQALIEAFRRIRPQLRLLVMGDEASEAYTEYVIGAGAQGYLCHASSEGELRSAVAVVIDGSIWAPRKVLSRLWERARAAAPDQAGAQEELVFTRREIEVLRLLVLGRSNREIADALGVDETTVKSHMARLMRKAGVRNRTALTLRSLEGRWTS